MILWSAVIRLLLYVEGGVLAAAVQADPQRAAAAVHGVLAAAAARFDPGLMRLQPAGTEVMVAYFACEVLERLERHSFRELALERMGGIPGLPALLEASVACYTTTGVLDGEEALDATLIIHLSRCMRLLDRLVLDPSRAFEPRRLLAPGLVERLQLLPLLERLPLHDRISPGSCELARLSLMGLTVVHDAAVVLHDTQLLLRYWREAGVQQLQVRSWAPRRPRRALRAGAPHLPVLRCCRQRHCVLC